MKRATTSPKFTAEQIEAAIKSAPEWANTEKLPYDATDEKAVSSFWNGAVVTLSGGYPAVRAALAERRKPGQRGPGRRSPKVAINIRLSPDVVDAFRATGDGWQTKVDGALKEWLQTHTPA